MALRLPFRLLEDPVQVTRSASASPLNWLRPRFSLRLLFAAVAVAAVVSAYLARAYERDRRERAAVAYRFLFSVRPRTLSQGSALHGEFTWANEERQHNVGKS